MSWLVLGDSVVGTSHRARNTPCQDAFRFKTCAEAGDAIIIAIADGAGSASRSDVGATLACDELINRAATLLTNGAPTRDAALALFTDVQKSLVAEADRVGCPCRELACTAMLAVLTADWAVFAQVGDGVIVIRDGDEYRTVFWPEPAEYANATDFLTDDGFAEQFRFDTVQCSVPEVAALTDGLQRLSLDYSARTPHVPFFRPVFETLRSASDLEPLLASFREFLDSPRINERTDDDKTLVLAIRRP